MSGQTSRNTAERFRVLCEFVHVNDPPDWWSAYEYPHRLDRDAAEVLARKWKAQNNYRNVRIVPADSKETAYAAR